MLVQYKNDNGFARGTSTSREDMGDGACETIFVEKFSIIQRANQLWQKLFNASAVATPVFAVLWLLSAFWTLFFPKSLDAAYFMEQGDTMAARGKFRNAVKHYNRALQLDPFLADGYRERGMCWEALGQFDKAENDFSRAKQLELEQRPELFL